MKQIYRFLGLFVFLVLVGTSQLMGQWVQTNGPNGGHASTLVATRGGTLFAMIENDTGIEYDFGIGSHDGIYRSTDNGASWTETDSGLGNAYINCLVMAPDDSTLYAGTTGGIFRSTDKGANWTSIGLSNYNVKSLAVSSDDSVLFAGTDYNGVFRSMDKGATWTVNSALKTSNVATLVIAPDDTTLFAGTVGGVARSTDTGASWQLVGLINLYITSLAVSPDNSTLIAGTAGKGIYRSTDKGTIWNPIGLTNHSIISLAVTSDDSTLFAGTDGGGIFHYSGGKWTQTGLSNLYVFSILILPDKSVFAGVFFGVFHSTDNGKTWGEADFGITHTDTYSLAASPDDSTIAAGTDIGLFLSTNDGSTWTRIGSSFYTIISLAFSPDGKSLYAGTDEHGFFHYSRNGPDWIKKDSSLSPGNLLVGITSLAVAPDGTVFAGTNLYTGGVETYMNNKWTLTNPSLMADGIRILAVSPDGKTLFSVSPQDEAYLSTDSGKSWTQTANVKDPNVSSLFITSLAVTPGGTLLAGTRYNGLYRSTDNGQSWTQTEVDAGATNLHITSIVVTKGGKLLTGTEEHGIYNSADNGKTWTPVSTGLEPQSVNSLTIAADGSTIFAGVSHAGVWKRPMSELTAVETSLSAIPARFRLDQNYPNPFNPSTNISFTLPQASRVRIDIYNILGQHIQTLENDYKKAGHYAIQFQAGDLASGIYLYRLQAGNFVQVKKMVLLK